MTLRGVDWAVVLGGSAAGAAILAGCVAFGEDGPPLTYARLGLAVLAAAAAFVLDEPAAAAVDAVPATRRRRTVARTIAAGVPLAVWAVGAVALHWRNPSTPLAALLVEGAGVVAVAVAASAALRSAGWAEPGEAVAPAVAAAVLAALIFQPPPRSVPAFPVADGWAASTALWATVLVVSTVVLVGGSADPFHRVGGS